MKIRFVDIAPPEPAKPPKSAKAAKSESPDMQAAFDKRAYQRDYMRQKRAAKKPAKG